MAEGANEAYRLAINTVFDDSQMGSFGSGLAGLAKQTKSAGGALSGLNQVVRLMPSAWQGGAQAVQGLASSLSMMAVNPVGATIAAATSAVQGLQWWFDRTAKAAKEADEKMRKAGENNYKKCAEEVASVAKKFDELAEEAESADEKIKVLNSPHSD